MEAQTRNEMGEVHVAPGTTSRSYNSNKGILVNCILRLVAILLTFIAAIVLGVANETIDIGIIKSTQFTAYVYFIIANVIVLLYSIASLVLSLANRRFSGRIAMHLSIGDLIMVVLLFSCNGAAAAVSIISDIGQQNTGWNQICSVLAKFCGSVKASIVLSMFAGVVYLLLVAFALVANQK
ncbi:CASP-like protein 1E1 [Carex rostrata]